MSRSNTSGFNNNKQRHANSTSPSIPAHIAKLLSCLEASSDPQHFINTKLKVSQLPQIKKFYLQQWRQRTGKFKSLPPQNHPWFYKHMQCEDAVLNSYREPPDIVVATHNSLVVAGKMSGPILPKGYRPYAHLERKERQRRSVPKRYQDERVDKLLGTFGVCLRKRQILPDPEIIQESSFLEFKTLHRYTILRSLRTTVSFPFPVRLMSDTHFSSNQLRTHLHQCCVHVARVQTVDVEMLQAFTLKCFFSVDSTDNPYISIMRANLQFDKSVVLTIPILRDPVKLKSHGSKPLCLPVRAYRHKRRRFKPWFGLSTNLSSRASSFELREV